MIVPKDVDSYIANSGSKARPILEEIRKIIKFAVPKAEEGINWSFPFYKYHGTLAHFAEYKNHVAIGFGSDLQDKDQKMLEKNGYPAGQKRIQIKFDQKVPATTITQILKSQAKINESKTTTKLIKNKL
jgi:uncharacterized protein YdhG (YjbR/CyaY superfamily)